MREYKVVVVNVMMKKTRGIETETRKNYFYYFYYYTIRLEYFTIVVFSFSILN